MAGIFISYRREDCPAHAGRLSDTLDARFGDAHVFMDVDTIELGVDFVQRIEQAIGDCDVVLAMIGDRWLNVTGRDGKRRIDQPGDFVRLELATALSRDDVRVIPVLVEGAQMPSAADLPEDLAALAHRNGIALTDIKWHSDTAVLIDAIERIIGPVAGPPQREAPLARDAAVGGRAPERKGLRGLLWLVPPVLSFGGASLIYFGAQAQRRTWVVAGIVYFAAVLLGVVIVGTVTEDDPAGDAAIGMWFAAWAASFVHVVVVRPRYLAIVDDR